MKKKTGKIKMPVGLLASEKKGKINKGTHKYIILRCNPRHRNINGRVSLGIDGRAARAS